MQILFEPLEQKAAKEAKRTESLPFRTFASLASFCSIALALLLLSSCGTGLPRTIPVSGQVTFDGKPPPASGNVLFLCTEPAEGYPMRPATAAFDTNGSFKAQTFDPGDGLMPGKYLVSIECWDTPPSMQGNPGKSFVPRKYQVPQTSGFTLDITPKSRPQDVKLDIVTKP